MLSSIVVSWPVTTFISKELGGHCRWRDLSTGVVPFPRILNGIVNTKTSESLLQRLGIVRSPLGEELDRVGDLHRGAVDTDLGHVVGRECELEKAEIFCSHNQ